MTYRMLDENSPKLIQPTGLNIELMEHQKAIVHEMINLENCKSINIQNVNYYGYVTPKNIRINSSMGILGDRVGSGKSYEIISLILENTTPKKSICPIEGTPFVSISEIIDTKNKSIKTNLLIIPPQITEQWIQFFKQAPTLKINVCTKISDAVDAPLDGSLDVIIITSKIIKCIIHKYNNVIWNRIIIDEADTIKIPDKFELKCIFLWLITGTPDGLLFHAHHYMSKFLKKINNWVFKCLTIQTNPIWLDISLKLPIPNKIIIKCFTPLELSVIQGFVPASIVSMINAGNIKGAIKALNCNKDTDQNILQLITHNIDNAIKNKEIELKAEKKKECIGNQLIEQEKKIKYLESMISRLKNKEQSIKDKIHQMNELYCPICMGEFTNPVLLKCCQNIFCFECLMIASHKLSNVCPLCKQKIIEQQMMIITNHQNKSIEDKEDEVKMNLQKDKSKMEYLMEIIKKKQNKIIVFANYDETLLSIQEKLKSENISYSLMKDNVSKIIDEFSSGNICVLLLNAKYYGAGLNLQMANDIIIYHRFTKEIEEQVIGRGQRIGRTTQLTIHYLIHNNEQTPVNDYNEVDYMDWLETEIHETAKIVKI